MPPLFVLFCLHFPLGFRADILFLVSTFECFVILLLSFGSVHFPDGFCSRFTSTFVTHFVLTLFCSRFPLTFQALVLHFHYQVAVCFRTFQALARPLAVTFGSDRIRTYQGKCERPSPADSYRLSSPERVLERRERDKRRLKTAGAESEFPSVPKNLRQRRGRIKQY